LIKVGNRVSLFHNIGKTGTVAGLKPIAIKTSFTGGTATNSWLIIVRWDDNTSTEEKIGDVMRID
tara:strand:+ start:4763 stop:4957 length:195 start_codon:yes stop_codon:yes gene_type:complete